MEAVSEAVVRPSVRERGLASVGGGVVELGFGPAVGVSVSSVVVEAGPGGPEVGQLGLGLDLDRPDELDADEVERSEAERVLDPTVGQVESSVVQLVDGGQLEPATLGVGVAADNISGAGIHGTGPRHLHDLALHGVGIGSVDGQL